MAEQQFRLSPFDVTLDGERVQASMSLLGKAKVVFETPLANISAVDVTPAFGDRVKCAITYEAGGKQKIYAFSGKSLDSSYSDFRAALRAGLPPSAKVTDAVTPDMTDLSAERTYSLGGFFFLKHYNRLVILMVWWILGLCTCACLPVAIYLTRRYRMRTDKDGLTILRFGTLALAWSEVIGYSLLRVEKIANGSNTGTLLEVTLLGAEGKPKTKVVLEGIDGTRFLAELEARGVAAA